MFLGNLESAAQSTPHSSYIQKHPLLDVRVSRRMGRINIREGLKKSDFYDFGVRPPHPP